MIPILAVMVALSVVANSEAAPARQPPSRLSLGRLSLSAAATPTSRFPRRTPRLPDKTAQLPQLADDQEPLKRSERAGAEQHHDFVDFGAHTGHKGSFGWYVDFPVTRHY